MPFQLSSARREHSADLLDLARHFLAIICHAANRPTMDFSPSALQHMLAYSWSRNPRELRHEMPRVSVLWPSRLVDPAALSMRLRGDTVGGPTSAGNRRSPSPKTNASVRC
jgi:DNA-binding NtrC family response regulator